jgi:hypothetical protein
MAGLKFKGIFSAALTGAALLALAGCAGQQQGAGGVFSADLPPLPQGRLVPAVNRAASADGSVSLDGDQFTAQAGANNGAMPPGSSYRLGPAAGATAWAQYSADIPAANRVTGITVQASDTVGAGPPTGPYYIALANYGTDKWEWRGPYTGASTTLPISAVAPASDYISPAGAQAHCAVLDYCPVGQTPQPLAVVNVTFDYTDGATSPGWITYTYGGGPTYPAGVYRILAQAGAQPENISTALDALSPEATLADSFLTISPDGEWLALITNRFDPEAEGWSALAIVKSDLSSGETIRAGGPGGVLVHPESIPAVASGGNMIVYSAQGGPHQQDLWAISRASTAAPWSDPLLLTGASAEVYNENPQISPDGTKVLFHCGPTPYGQYGTMCAEVNTDGTGYQIILRPTDPPAGYLAKQECRSPDYAPDGSIVFESDWDADPGVEDNQRVWRLPAGGGDPVLLTGIEGGNSPSVLPDGRIVHLWLGRPNSLFVHELTVMNADGSNFVVLVPDVDVNDSGMGAGASP